MKEEIEEFAGKHVVKNLFKKMGYLLVCAMGAGLFQLLLLELFANIPIAFVGAGLIVSVIIMFGVEKDEREAGIWFTALVLIFWGGVSAMIMLFESNPDLGTVILFFTTIISTGIITGLSIGWALSWKNKLIISKKFPLIGIRLSREVNFVQIERTGYKQRKMNENTFRINNMIELLLPGDKKSVLLEKLNFLETDNEVIISDGQQPLTTVSKEEATGIQQLLAEIKEIPLVPQT